MELCNSPKVEAEKYTRRWRTSSSIAAFAIVAASMVHLSPKPQLPGNECWELIKDFQSNTSDSDDETASPLPYSLQSITTTNIPNRSTNSSVISAAKEVAVPRYNQGFPEQFLGYQRTQSFESLGGLQLNFFRDDNLQINSQALNGVLQAALDAEYEDSIVQAHMFCFKQRLIGHEDFMGQAVNVYLPTSPYVCMQGPVMMYNSDEDACNAGGFTMPNPSFIGVNLFGDQTIILAPGVRQGEDPQAVHAKALGKFIHEFFGHLYYSLMGYAFPLHPSGLDYEEQHAKAIESAIREELQEQGQWNTDVFTFNY